MTRARLSLSLSGSFLFSALRGVRLPPAGGFQELEILQTVLCRRVFSGVAGLEAGGGAFCSLFFRSERALFIPFPYGLFTPFLYLWELYGGSKSFYAMV